MAYLTGAYPEFAEKQDIDWDRLENWPDWVHAQAPLPEYSIFCHTCAKSIATGRVCDKPFGRACGHCTRIKKPSCGEAHISLRGQVVCLLILRKDFDNEMNRVLRTIAPTDRGDLALVTALVRSDEKFMTAMRSLMAYQVTYNREVRYLEVRAKKDGDVIYNRTNPPRTREDFALISHSERRMEAGLHPFSANPAKGRSSRRDPAIKSAPVAKLSLSAPAAPAATKTRGLVSGLKQRFRKVSGKGERAIFELIEDDEPSTSENASRPAVGSTRTTRSAAKGARARPEQGATAADAMEIASGASGSEWAPEEGADEEDNVSDVGSEKLRRLFASLRDEPGETDPAARTKVQFAGTPLAEQGDWPRTPILAPSDAHDPVLVAAHRVACEEVREEQARRSRMWVEMKYQSLQNERDRNKEREEAARASKEAAIAEHKRLVEAEQRRQLAAANREAARLIDDRRPGVPPRRAPAPVEVADVEMADAEPVATPSRSRLPGFSALVSATGRGGHEAFAAQEAERICDLSPDEARAELLQLSADVSRFYGEETLSSPIRNRHLRERQARQLPLGTQLVAPLPGGVPVARPSPSSHTRVTSSGSFEGAADLPPLPGLDCTPSRARLRQDALATPPSSSAAAKRLMKDLWG